MHRVIARLAFLLIVLAIGTSSFAQQQQTPQVRSALSQASIVFGDSVALTVTARNIDKAIDLSSLERDFIIAGRSSSREVSIINGVETATSSWVIQIEPKQPGVLTVPPVSVGEYKSQPLALNVSQAPTGNNRVLFIEASIDNANPYVNSQIILTIKVWRSIEMLDSSKVNLGSDQFQTVALERTREYLDTRDGKEYIVEEEQFALFPQSAGAHTFGPIELRAKVPVNSQTVRGFIQPSRTIRRISSPITVNVKARPSGTVGQWWLPASNVQLKESWSGDTASIDANSSITRTIEVIATGVVNDQLPELKMPTIDGIKLYADNPNQASVATDEGVVTTQTYTWAVVPEKNGEVAIPAVTFNWFNTNTGSAEVAEIAPQTLFVNGVREEAAPLLSPTVSNSQNATRPDEANPKGFSASELSQTISEQSPVLWVLLGAIAVLFTQGVGFLAHVAWKQSKRTEAVSGAKVYDLQRVPPVDSVTAAAKRRDPLKMQGAVLDWAGKFWPETPPQSLLGVAERLNEPELVSVFQQIDKTLFSAGLTDDASEVDMSEVAKRLQSGARRLMKSRQNVSQRSHLPAL